MSTLPGNNNPYGITDQNVQLIFIGSVVKKLRNCKLQCIDFIEDNLNINNCITHFTFSMEQDCETLIESTAQFILRNIKQVYVQQREQFCRLSTQEIHRLLQRSSLSSQKLSSKDLEDLLFSIYKWMSADARQRLNHFALISKKLPLKEVDGALLRQIYKQNKSVKQNSVCKAAYLKAIESKFFHEEPISPASSDSFPENPPENDNEQESSPSSNDEDSGSSGVEKSLAKLSKIYTSSEESEDLDNLAPEAGARDQRRAQKRPATHPDDSDVEFLEVTQVKRKVLAEIDLLESESEKSDISADNSGQSFVMYFLSGENSNKILLAMDMSDYNFTKITDIRKKCDALFYNSNKLFTICTKNPSVGKRMKQQFNYFDLNSQNWATGAVLRYPRFDFRFIFVQDEGYVFGGANGNEPELGIEYFGDVTCEKEKGEVLLGELPHSRVNHGLGLIGDKVYMVGGDSETGDRTDLGEYDLKTGTWRTKAPMPTGRTGLCVAVKGSKLWAIGGALCKQAGDRVRTVEVYDSDTDEWSSCAPLVRPRVNAGNLGLPTMESYDSGRNAWTVVENCHLPCYGLYHSVAVVRR